ncbi:hypothetical protein HHK36_011726 [Tetracentron sinense]|uniref:Major facilitator superfamily (MFS) profile domain-containing protein n=1 Tax=Tetracentron sinense TaxID=13715 RepID=A0A835DK51_TETSI|nr:hypothetical protein HHK36_011726 [Tetracentron sinense]
MEVSVQQELTKGGWRSCICIIGVEFTERFAFYGMAGNLITYLTNELGESIVMAAKNVNAWFGVAALLPLLGAFVADSYLGRFNTILFASIIYVMGLVMLTVTVSVIPMRFRYFMFFLSIYMATVGAGGHRPCVQTFGADQFDDDKPEDKKAKSTFFNWWYFGVCGGSSAAMLILFYIQENVGWAMGFGIPAFAMAVALLVFLLGRKSYKRVIPRGSPLTRVLQVFVAACRKRHLTVSMDGHGQYCCEEAEVGEDMEVQPWSQNHTQTHQFK